MRRAITDSSLYAATTTVTVGSTSLLRMRDGATAATARAAAGYSACVQASAPSDAQKIASTTTTAPDSTLARMRRAVAAEIAVLVLVVAAQGVLFGRLLHTATNYDEDVYLAAVDALRHGQTLGSQVFAAQFPGFYDLLRGLSFLTGIGVASLRAGVLAITLAGTVGGWLVGRRFAGALGGLLVAALLVIAPPLDLFGWQVLADPPVLALALLALGLATL